MTPVLETVLRAVARAHHKTLAPIVLHSYSPGEVARQQIAILRDEGMNLKRVTNGRGKVWTAKSSPETTHSPFSKGG